MTTVNKSRGLAPVAVLTALCLQLASLPAFADAEHNAGSSAPAERSVDDLNAEAVQKFKAKEYEAAIRLFEQAYELSPEPNYLFNIGRVYEEKGDFPAAIDHYERFIKAPGVDIEARDLALERLRVLRAIMAETEVEQAESATPEPSAESSVEPTPASTEPVDEPPPAVDEPQPTPKLRIAGYVLLGVGGAVLIAGAGVGGAALARERDLAQTKGYEARTALVDEGKQFALAADGLFIAGGAVALTGLVLTLVSLRRRGGAGQTRAAVWPTVGRRRAGLAVDVQF